MNKRNIYWVVINILVVWILLINFWLIPVIYWTPPKSIPFEKVGIISFSSDDGYIDDYQNTYRFIMEMGYRMTFYVIVGNIGKIGSLSWDNLLEMQKNGCEIASHSLNHQRLTTLSWVNASKEIIDSKKILGEHDIKVNSFSFPFGDYNQTLMILANKTYDYVRCGNNVVSVSNDLIFMKNLIDELYQNKTWLHFYFHSTDVWNTIFPDTLRYIKSKNIPVLTVIQAFYFGSSF